MTGPADILRRLGEAGPSDGDLLARFTSQRDQAAFAELVRRHGPLVLGVCRRVTGHADDAEDAFQAVFLVLARKAGRIVRPDLLGNWLHGVAVRVASRARRSAARRRAREVAVSSLPDSARECPSGLPELGPILDEELAALPEWYREAILLCDLRGVSREEAALILGVPAGTVSSRLANGRKKLAARLMRRGVSLSVAGLLGVVGQAQAGVSVSSELFTKTCGLVADWSAGGAVPSPLIRLSEGGFAVRKMLLLGVLMVAAAAGAVVAAGSGDQAPAEPPRPVATERGEQAAQGRGEAKAGEKVAFTTQPRLRIARDYQLGDVRNLVWSPDGTMLAFQGMHVMKFGDRSVSLPRIQLDGDPFNPTVSRPTISLEAGREFVGFTADGKGLVTALREYQLVSGLHKLQYITVNRSKGDIEITTRPGPTVELDADNTFGYAFAADGKTYRTLGTTLSAPGVVSKVRVTSVDASLGKTLKTLLVVEGEAVDGYRLSPRGKKLAVMMRSGEASIYDLDSGKRLWTKATKLRPDTRFSGEPWLEFSQDGTRLFVAARLQAPLVLKADSGEELPALENVHLIVTFGSCFSADGRLLCLRGEHAKPQKKTDSLSDLGRYMGVWDTDSGKLLKRWNGAQPSEVAFHPSRPVLAILEPNGENTTRLGLWDFSAEVEKK